MSNPPHCALSMSYIDKYIEGAMNSEFLGLQIDHPKMWKNRTDQTLPQLSGVCYAVRLLFHISDIDTQIYFACFLIITKCGIIFWDDLLNTENILTLKIEKFL